MLLFISRRWRLPPRPSYSNTSHVIVYPAGRIMSALWRVFKYISCYCLSRLATMAAEQLRGFKYISCYCLSALRRGSASRHSHSNTSHVIVYRPRGPAGTFWLMNSNTSHVIVYRALAAIRKEVDTIQIHLMLLFIANGRSHKQTII